LKLAVVLLAFSRAQVAAGVNGPYKCELQLPVDLYTSDGVLLEKGKFGIEVRQEKDHYLLAVVSKDKVLARVRGETVSEDESKQVSVGMPLVGTLRLEEPSEPAKETTSQSASNPTSYLPRLSWRVTLRVFETPNQNDVVLLFRKIETAESPVAVVFRLFKTRPK
jgi:hypothetical protein